MKGFELQYSIHSNPATWDQVCVVIDPEGRVIAGLPGPKNIWCGGPPEMTVESLDSYLSRTDLTYVGGGIGFVANSYEPGLVNKKQTKAQQKRRAARRRVGGVMDWFMSLPDGRDL